MNLYFKLVARNLVRNARIYSAYFVSMTMAVVIFYVLKSIEYNETVSFLSVYYENIRSGIVIASSVVTIAVAILILYSNAFFIRRRKKEIGLYALVGMPHRKIAGLIAVETLLASLISLCIGLVLGVVISKLNFYMLLRLLDEKVFMEMTISLPALAATAQFFGAVSALTLITNAVLIYRVQLIELFKAESKNEKHIGNPGKIQLVLGFLSIVCLGASYYLALDLTQNFEASSFYLSFGLVVVGTFGIYIFGMPMLLKLLQCANAQYYKKYNMVIFRQVSHNVFSNAKMLAVLTLLISCTLGAMSTTFALYDSQLLKSDLQAPISYIIDYKDTPATPSEVETILETHSKENRVIFNEYIEMPIVDLDGFDLGAYERDLSVIPQTVYNRILSQIDLTEKSEEFRRMANVGKGQSMLVTNWRRRIEEDQIFLGSKVESGDLTLTIVDISPLGIDTEYMPVGALLVVNDQDYEKIKSTTQAMNTRSYIMVENHKDAKALTEDLSRLLGEDSSINYFSHYAVYKSNLADKATILFIGVYVGLIFLIASGSTLSIKQLTGALRDRQTFKTLRNIGVSEGGVKEIISKQIAVNFFVPVMLAAIHLTFALNFVASVFEENITHAVLISGLAFMAIYLVYYLNTIRSYYKLVSTT